MRRRAQRERKWTEDNESRRLVHRYIYCEEIVDGWGTCDWELSVDDLCDMCDMNCMDGHDQRNKM